MLPSCLRPILRLLPKLINYHLLLESLSCVYPSVHNTTIKISSPCDYLGSHCKSKINECQDAAEICDSERSCPAWGKVRRMLRCSEPPSGLQQSRAGAHANRNKQTISFVRRPSSSARRGWNRCKSLSPLMSTKAAPYRTAQEDSEDC